LLLLLLLEIRLIDLVWRTVASTVRQAKTNLVLIFSAAAAQKMAAATTTGNQRTVADKLTCPVRRRTPNIISETDGLYRNAQRIKPTHERSICLQIHRQEAQSWNVYR
jgi:hypothetical protein